ncbi:hypothetical protein ACH46N_24155 [Streptomyces pristinaespiralis]|uniref:Circumsporozoite protein n=1 Tax=Streptomyces pristinaespiralis TaxID=38300 RepID=A0A0M5IU43_STRPR|nr:hypothetical protein [Streptomyces pristinaespiralis]ALC22461.1 Circumsporozoite protein [Streptomyces pristinaespiralis]QMU14938.1 hypothetical protein H3L99_16120 [Streptomyces pristinaespiralis]
MGSGTEVSGDGRPNELVRDLVRSVVAGLAPEELPLVDGLRRFDDATVVRRLSGRAERREPLGFGAGEIVMLVTPVVWLVLDEVGRRVLTGTVDAGEQRVRAALRRVFRRSAAPVEVPPLTREQMAEVRALVLAAAEKRRLSRRRAEEIADAVVAELALSDASGASDAPESSTSSSEAASGSVSGAPDAPALDAPRTPAPRTPDAADAPTGPAAPAAPGNTGTGPGTGTGTGQG